jgi:NFACT protein RNA binding domain/NFACT N-terminal and middle domains
MDSTLVGGQVQRVTVARVAQREIAVLRLRVPGENAYLLIAGGATGVGLVNANGRDALRGAMAGNASPAQAQWRATLEGARVARIEERTVVLSRKSEAWLVRTGPRGAVFLEKCAAVPDVPNSDGEAPQGLLPQAVRGSLEPARDTLEARGARIVSELVNEQIGGRHNALRRALEKAIDRIDRRANAIRGDLTRAKTAEQAAQRARLFVAQASHAPRGATKLVAIDWAEGEQHAVEMELHPARGARGQIEAIFKRARRLKEGAKIARERLTEAETALAELRELARILSTEPSPDIPALQARAQAAAPRDVKVGSSPVAPSQGIADGGHPGVRSAMRSRPHAQASTPAYRAFVGASGNRILVGRGAEKNDVLTFRVAKPSDLWLHAKSRAGAHVVVPLEKGASCPAEVLVEAAHLAAHFSDARAERIVDVQYTPRRYVRRPRGSAAGFVVVDREKVIALRCDDDLLRRLLASESD